MTWGLNVSISHCIKRMCNKCYRWCADLGWEYSALRSRSKYIPRFFFYCCTVYSDTCRVHSPTNAHKYRSYIFRSSTIIGKLALNLAKVMFILKHSAKLRLYLLCGCVAACNGMACVLHAVHAKHTPFHDMHATQPHNK